jgi:hypothetical protein
MSNDLKTTSHRGSKGRESEANPWLGAVAISAHAERRTCSALAVDAVTSNDYLGWFFWKRERDCAAVASGVAHRKPLRRPSEIADPTLN